MRTFELNRKLAAMLAGVAATGLLTVGTLVYAAGENEVSLDVVANAASVAAPAEAGEGEAIRTLRRAAEQGSVSAMWRLAHMYRMGRDVARSDKKAMELFRRIADEHAEVDPRSPRGRLVADSFVNLAELYMSGSDAASGQVAHDDIMAARLLIHAATYFAEPTAQYRLAMMYMDGRGVEKNMRRAVSWLMLAARKQHIEAQGALGRLLLQGPQAGEGVPQIRKTGLMWLEIANRYADPGTQGWISDEHQAAFAEASEEETAAAIEHAERWIADHAQTN